MIKEFAERGFIDKQYKKRQAVILKSASDSYSASKFADFVQP